MKRLMTLSLGGLLLSCQGPAAVLAQEAAPNAATGSPHAAITAALWERALDVPERRLAHYVKGKCTPAIRPKLVRGPPGRIPAELTLEDALRLARA